MRLLRHLFARSSRRLFPEDSLHRITEAIAAGEMIVAPGASDGIGARLIEQAGFGAVYASGGAIARLRFAK